MNYYADPFAEWCVLIDNDNAVRNQHKIKKEGLAAFKPLRIQPFELFKWVPPGPEWKLQQRGLTREQAVGLLRSSDTMQLYADMLNKAGFKYKKKACKIEHNKERERKK